AARRAGRLSGPAQIAVARNAGHPPQSQRGRRRWRREPAPDRSTGFAAGGESLRDPAAGEGPAEQGAARAARGHEPAAGARATPAGFEREAEGIADVV